MKNYPLLKNYCHERSENRAAIKSNECCICVQKCKKPKSIHACHLTCIIIIIIIKRGWQCKAGRERLTPYQSEDPNPTTATHRKKEEKGKTVGDKK